MLFALMLPMILALGGIVIGVGNWYVHGKNLQTKADAGAFGRRRRVGSFHAGRRSIRRGARRRRLDCTRAIGSTRRSGSLRSKIHPS